MIWLLAVALAGEPDLPVADVPAPDIDTPGDTPADVPEELELPSFVEDGEVVHEVIVHGDILVEQARLAVIQSLRDQGYREEKDKGDYIRFRHDARWKGEVRVYDDGWVKMKRQPVQVEAPEMPWAKKNSPLAWAGCVVYPFLCVKAGGQLVGKRKLMGQKERTLEGIDPEVRELADAVADRETEATINELPGRLDALWYQGVPLEGEGTLQTAAERKQALLDYWNTRTNTIWGDRVRLAVEAYMRGEIQGGPDEFTRVEVRAFNAQRFCDRSLDLWSSWEAVAAGVEPAY